MKSLFSALSSLLAATLITISAVFSPATAQNTNPFKHIFVFDGTSQLTNGLLTISNFASTQGVLMANGTLSGSVEDQQISQPVSIPILITTANCDALHLKLGTTNLNLSGKDIKLNAVNLNVTSQESSRKLLANQLCVLSKLVENNASPDAITQKLNKIYRTLR